LAASGVLYRSSVKVTAGDSIILEAEELPCGASVLTSFRGLIQTPPAENLMEMGRKRALSRIQLGRVAARDETFTTQFGIVEGAIQVAPRPRKGMIPPE
jgi:hypothetical protein